MIPKQAPYVVVGAGIHGLSTAYHLAKELRATDAYRSWALISADNQASLRAFQKASFTPVCDVIHAKMANVDRVVCRPPDPEAQELLGNAE